MENRKIDGVITFDDYKVIEINYKLNKAFDEEGPIQLSLELGHGVRVDYAYNEMTVQLGVKIFEDAEENGYPFEMAIKLEGVFSCEEKSYKIDKFLPNALAILYPYIRSIVSSYTAMANIPVLNLPTINMFEYLNNDNKL